MIDEYLDKAARRNALRRLKRRPRVEAKRKQAANRLVGKRFGKLTVLRRYAAGSQYSQPLWDCRCDCGNEVTIWDGNLTNGNTKSCGCIRKSVEYRAMMKSRIEAHYASLLGTTKQHPVFRYRHNYELSNGRRRQYPDDQ
jgi:hypothetical protein